MNRSSLTALLTARWLLLHLLFVVAAVATGFLAWWQWGRAHEAGGSFQNLGYALQWPMFGAFTLFLWYRVARMHLHETFASEGTDERSSDVRSPDPRAADGAGRAPAGSIDPGARGRSNRRLVPLPAERVDAAEDPQMAEYNRYLAELNRFDEGAAQDAPDEREADEREAGQHGGERTRSS